MLGRFMKTAFGGTSECFRRVDDAVGRADSACARASLELARPEDFSPPVDVNGVPTARVSRPKSGHGSPDALRRRGA